MNGTWLNSTEIPSDKSRFHSIFNVLYDETQENLKAIIQESAQAKAEEGNVPEAWRYVQQLHGRALANELGIKPLQPYLDSLSTIQSHSDVAKVMGEDIFGLSGLSFMFTRTQKIPT